MIIRIDGKECACEKGEFLLAIARRNGITIPTLCHHDSLEVETNSEKIQRERAMILSLLSKRAPESPEIARMCRYYKAPDIDRFLKVDELAEGIKTFFYEPELGRILGGAAARRARVTHNPDTNFKRLIGIYRSIVSS